MQNMIKLLNKLIVLIFLVYFAFVSPSFSNNISDKNIPIKNIIYFIGDGMGPSHIILARYYSLFVLNKELNMTSIMNEGSTAYMTHHSKNYLVTDSAAAGTALATGFKTNNDMVSMTPDGKKRTTILEKAQVMGKSTGLVTNTELVDATPAVFASHNKSRLNVSEIAVDMLEHKVNVMLAGGLAYFIPQGEKGSYRKDARNLIVEAQKAGYTVVKSAMDLSSIDIYKVDKLLGLFALSHLPFELDRDTSSIPSLAKMTEIALNILSRNQAGFFLMVEGGRIDHAAHYNDAASVLNEVLAFDKAIGVALAYQKKDPNTLIVVTADHETGGITITSGKTTGEKLEYPTVEDLKKLGKIKASFEVIGREVKKAKDIKDIKSIIKKYTDIDISDTDAEGIKDGKPWLPVFKDQPNNWIGRALSNDLKVTFSTGEHSTEPLMLFAKGPYANMFTGFLDNTDVFKKISASLSMEKVGGR